MLQLVVSNVSDITVRNLVEVFPHVATAVLLRQLIGNVVIIFHDDVID